MPSTPLSTFYGEVARLRTLYAAVRHSFRETAITTSAAVEGRKIKKYTPFTINPESATASAVLPSVQIFLSRLQQQFPRYLRETLFVRVISALEVFLIATVREVFVARRDLFHTEQRIEFSVGELLSADSVVDLWNRMIARELRKLQNQGFGDVVKYYRTRLGIEVGPSPVPLGYIEELHMRRHLLVHRLGRTDEQYRDRYNTAAKSVTIREEELAACFDRCHEFAAFVYSQAMERVRDSPSRIATARPEMRVELLLELQSGARDVAAREFIFQVVEHIVQLGDILESRQGEGDKTRLIVAGSRTSVRGYLKELRRRRDAQEVTLHEVTARRWGARATFPAGVLRDIAAKLPARPWPVGIHKSVALEFGLSKRDAWDAIGCILESVELTQLIASTDAAADTGTKEWHACV